MTDTDILALSGQLSGGAALGFGAMRLPSDEKTCRRMFDMYLDGGFNYFDTAYVYGHSEAMLEKAMVKHHPRSSYLLADKLPHWMAHSIKDCDRLFNESLKRCGVDYFDFYLVHSIDDGSARHAEDIEAFQWTAAQVKKGTVRHAGFSFHGSAATLDRLLTDHPEMEFVQLQLNYMDILRGQAGAAHEVALKHKKPIIVMEPIKGGTLAKLPAAAEALLKTHAPQASVASWAMRYAAALEGATCVLSGMSTPEQTADNLTTFSPLKPLTEEEYKLIDAVLEELSKVAVVPCTACKYCVADCPQQIEIPVCFSLYNEEKRGSAHWNQQVLYDAVPKGRRANDCIRCGACLSHCPQHIDIPEKLTAVATMFK